MKRLFWIIIIIILPFGVFAQSQEEEDKGYITSLIEDNLSGVSRDVNILGFQGALSSEATIEVLTVADEEGIWLTLEDIVLSWNRSALLRGAIDINEISAERIIIARAPVAEQSGPSPEAQPFSLPELPVSISLEQLDIGRIELAEVFLGEPVEISLRGTAELAGGEGSANVIAERLGAKRGIFEIDGSYINESRVLDLLLNLEEGEDGIAARLLDLPGRPAIGLRVEGEAPLDDYAATLAIATDGEDRLNGTFQLTSDPAGRLIKLDVGGDVTPLFDPAYRAFFGNDAQLYVDARQSNDGRIEVSDLAVQSQRLNLSGALVIGAQGWPERMRLSGGIIRGTEPVLLPVAGAETYVSGMRLAINYDGTVSDDWTADITVDDFERPGLFIDELGLEGGGILRNGEGAEVGLLTATLNYGAEGLRLDEAGASEALGDAVTGTLNARRNEGEPTEISQLTLSGAGIDIAARATIQGADAGLRTTATATMQVEGLQRFSTLAGQDLGGAADFAVQAVVTPLDGLFDILLSGTTNDLSVGITEADNVLEGEGDLRLRVIRDTDGTRLEEFRVATNAAEIVADADLTSDGSDATFAARLEDLALVLPELSGAATAEGNVQINTERVIDFSLTGTAPDTVLTVSGIANPAETGQTINVDVTAAVNDLSRYAAVADLPLDGAATLNVNGVLLSDGLRFDVDVTAETQDVTTGIERIDPFLANDGTLSVEIARPAADVFQLSNLSLMTPALQARGNTGIGPDGPTETDLNIVINDARVIDPSLRGPVTAQINATPLNAEDMRIMLDLDGAGSVVDADIVLNRPTTEISGDVSARLTNLEAYQDLVGQPIGGDLTLTASGALLPDLSRFDARANIQTNDLGIGNPTVDALLAGAGRVNVAASLEEGTLNVSALQANTPQFSINGSFAGTNGAGDGRFDAVLEDVGLLADGISGAARATGTATIDDNGDLQISLDGNAPGAVITANTLIDRQTNEISGEVTADVANLSAYADLIGQPVRGSVNLLASGSLLPDLSRFDAEAQVQSQNLAIGNPTVDPLLRGQGRVNVAANRSDGQLTVRAFEATTPQFTVTGSLNGAGTAGEGQFEANLRDVGVLTDQISGPANASGTASLDESGNWGVDVSGTGPGGLNAQVRGQVLAGGQLDLDINGSAPLALSNAALEPRRLSGTANFDLSLNGPPSLGALGGQINIVNGRLAAPTLAQALTDIGGRISFADSRAQVNLQANVENGGGLTITGPVGLESPNQADVTVNVRNVVLRDPDLYRSSVAGTVTMTGPLQGGARIVGRLELGQTDIQVPSSSISTLGDLPEVRHLNAPVDVSRTLQRAGLSTTPGQANANADRGGPSYPLDIRIDAPSRIFIRGRGLDAELGGRLDIGGTTNDVIPVGRFELIRGRIDILQQRFNLTEGSATLQGDFDPFIRLVATTQTDGGTTISIIVEGPAGEPEVRFESVPDLPQDEVLSQLIFGRDLDSISPLQAIQLASAISTLAGRGGGAVDRLRRNIGLDDFDVTTNEEGQTAVRAGQYLSENVYTDVTVTSEGDTEINLNLDLTDDITAKGSVDQDGQTSIGIFFERDY